MKTEKIIWGLVLIFIGGVLLLSNFGVINFYWHSLWRFWPVLFILWGANLLFSRYDKNNTGPILSAVFTVAVLVFIGYQGSRPAAGRDRNSWFNFRHNSDDKRDTGDYKNVTGNSKFTEPFIAGTSRAELNINGGATSYELEDSTANLFDANVSQHFGNYTLEKVSRDSMEVVTFRMRGKQRWNMDDMDANTARLSINSRPLWNVNVNMGAGETDFDLSKFRVASLKLEGGAASFKVKVGSLHPLTSITVNTGVAEVDLSVPASAGCRIQVSSGLSSRDFNGFNKQSDGVYVTDNYGSSAKKIEIRLKGGLSDFEVNRY